MCVKYLFDPKKKKVDVCFLCFEVDVMYSTVTWKPWRQKKEMRVRRESVGSSGSSQSLGSLEDLGLGSRTTGGTVYGTFKRLRRLTGQLKFNMRSSLCQQACHLDRHYGCSGVWGVHSSQQDVIKGTAAKSKPTVRTPLCRCPCPACSSLWQQHIKQKQPHTLLYDHLTAKCSQSLITMVQAHYRKHRRQSKKSILCQTDLHPVWAATFWLCKHLPAHMWPRSLCG